MRLDMALGLWKNDCMDPTSLLPGLGKMLEERLGRLGHFLGTVTIVSAALFIVLLPITLIIVIIQGVASIFTQVIIVDAAALSIFITVILGVIGGNVFATLLYRWLDRIENMRSESNESKKSKITKSIRLTLIVVVVIVGIIWLIVRLIDG